MIRGLGPQPRLVDFYSAICSVSGRTVQQNQEMVLRLLWMPTEVRRAIFVEVEAVPDVVMKKLGQAVRSYPPVGRLPAGDLAEARPEPAAPPARYVGKEEVKAGLAPVYLRWSGHDAWKPGMVDHLFFGPSAMGASPSGAPIAHFCGYDLVSLQDNC